MNSGRNSSPILPPAMLGLIGGGQLGRMTALAARSAGYKIHAFDPDPQCAIRPIADAFVAAGWEDTEAATVLARNSEVVTFEIERVSVAVLEAAAQIVPVRPGPAVLEVVQNKLRQKQWLQRRGFPVGAFRAVGSPEQLREAAREFGTFFLKAAEGGYDGRSQSRVGGEDFDAGRMWKQFGGKECIAEKALELRCELSVLVARRSQGEIRVYPPAMNHHENQILSWSVIPAPVDEKTRVQAQEIAQEIATSLELEGLLAVEMFVTNDGQLLVNELAPRTHNSYHASERACATGQFEQLVRAICNLPLGSVEVVRPTAIVNLLGDLWGASTPPDVAGSLVVPETRLHLYGKSPARSGRKMGHISATGRRPEEAVQRALRAKQLFAGGRLADDRECSDAECDRIASIAP